MASRIVGGPKTRRMLKRFPAEAKTEVVKALDEAIRLVQASAVAGAPSRSGTMRGALASPTALGRRDQGLRVEFGLRTKALRRKAFYAPFVEFGAKGWSRETKPANRRGRKGQLISRAWPGRTIPTRSPRPFLGPALDRNLPRIRERVNAAVRTAILTVRRG